MNKLLRNILFWTPRVLAILIAGLMSLLSTEVFAEGYSFWQSILGFLIHMLLAFAVILMLSLAWRWEWIGALGFIAFGVWYIVIAWDHNINWIVYTMLSGVRGGSGFVFGRTGGERVQKYRECDALDFLYSEIPTPKEKYSLIQVTF